MADTPDQIPLASEFPPASQGEWRKLVDAALKGASFENRLVSETYDGHRVEPLYARVKNARPVASRQAAPWQVLARADHPDPAAANAEILHELENGATGLSLVFAGAIGAHGFGLEPTEAGLARVLDGVHLDAKIAVEFDLSTPAREVPSILAKLIGKRRIEPDRTNIRAGYDPLGLMAQRGGGPAAWNEIAPLFAKFVGELAARGFAGPFAAADGRTVHAAGGSEAQELAFALSNAVAYLRALEKSGIALDRASGMIFFRLAADADQFLTIAKFRSLRKLWARVEQACGLEPSSVFVSAETAWRMMTKRDPYVNMLRATIAVTAAGLGGADAISVLPFTAAIGLPDRFARRVARNTQLILLEEANLYRVVDPAAGSGGIEYLTGQICETAWALFQNIEAAGGAAAALEQNLLQRKIAAVRAARQTAVARRQDSITGSSDYPQLDERQVKVLDVAPVVPAALPAAIEFEALPEIRVAEPFEALRDAADRASAKTGARPKVFLATLGKLADFNSRATFARNFYEAGGVHALANDGFATHADLVTAFKASGTNLACLCSSDAVYAREAVDAAKALVAVGAVVHFAGRPVDLEPELREAGVNMFIHSASDALATLQATHDILGLK